MMKEKETKETEEIVMGKEEIQKMFSDAFNDIVSTKLSDTSFSDEQRGQVKEWLKEMYGLGVKHGNALSLADEIGEEGLSRTLNSMRKIFDGFDEKNSFSFDTMYYRTMLHHEKEISNNLRAQLQLMECKNSGWANSAMECCCTASGHRGI